MTRFTAWQPDDFDGNGLLKAPRLFQAGLVVLARAWWLTGLAMASGDDGRWLAQVYPDMVLLWVGLSAGLPAFIMLFCYPVRAQFPGTVRAGYLLVLMAALAMTAGDGLMLMRLSPAQWGAGWLLMCTDAACLAMLWPDRRLRAVFWRGPASRPSSDKPQGEQP